MKPPLFRGLSTVDNTWAIGFYVEYDGKPYIQSEHEKTPVEAETVGMATGQTDKNGQLIFQHDRIVDAAGREMSVSWSDRYASFALVGIGWQFTHWFGEAVDSEDTEIIGHIHDR